jgi:hypothetical protein
MKVYRKSQLPHAAVSNVVVTAALLALSLTLFFGCAHTHTEQVWIPPIMDLAPYRIIGVIDFDTNAGSELQQSVTQNYVQTVQAAQPGVRFLELGGQEAVLAKVSREQLDYEAVQSIGRVFNIDAVMFGELNLSEIKPNVRLSSSTWQSMKVGAFVEAVLVAKLWETDSGVLRWTNSTRGQDSVARLSASTNGNISFGAKDPEETYGKLIPQLVYANTPDFRSHYEYRKVK